MSINDEKLNVEALTSSEWRSDGTRARCTSCHINFHDLFNRRHHCRLCGDVFCDKCTHRRALIPPSAIVLKHTKLKQPLNPQSASKQLQKMGLDSSLQNRDEEERMSYAYKRTSSRTQSSSVEQASNPNNSYDLEHKLHSLKQDKDYQYNLTINQSILEDDLLSLSVASSSAFSYTSESVISPTSMLPLHNQHQYEHQNEPPEQQEQVILYGKGLEQRMKLAREPLRVCLPCHDKLSHLQEELRNCNSNAMRYNAIDPTDHIRRMLNSPLAFTLGHEIRKAAYTLNNLLPLPKRMGSFLPDSAIGGGFDPILKVEQQCCKNNMSMGMGVGAAGEDGVRIPAYLLERAKGIAIMTIFKIGMGIAGFEFGTGLLISRLGSASCTDDIDAENGAYGSSIGDDNEWSPPCAIGSASACIGAMAGVQISDHVFLCMTDEAVDIMSGDEGSVQLGVDIGVAVGPVGRSAEADLGIGTNMRQLQQQQQKLTMAPIYTYSQSKGLYAGISLDGKVVVIRHEVNQKFYGQPVSSRDLLNGSIPTPLAAQPLYDALKRCHVYASASKPPKNLRAA